VAEEALLRVRLTPRGGRSALTRWEAGVLHARVASPPVDGEANRALVVLLSRELDVPKSRLVFVSGETSRNKTLRVAGMCAKELERRLKIALG
jgi:uncharacterized protein (TIGR00251 family)